MKISTSLAISALLLASCKGNAGDEQKRVLPVPEKSAAAPCVLTKGDPALCDVDFVSLYISKDALYGKKITIVGYVGLNRGVLSLYPSELEFSNSVNNRMLIIKAPLQTQKNILKECGYRYCSIAGDFERAQPDREGNILGYLRDPTIVIPVEQRKEKSQDLKVSVEDMGR